MEKKNKLNFIFFALMAWGEGISGGDRIAIEFARRWSKSYPVTIYLWEEGYKMYQRQKLNDKNITYKVVNMNPWKKMGFVINYIARIIAGIWIALRIHPDNERNTVVYSATEFWMDSLPGVILKLRFPEISWVTTWFQTAPNPLKGFKEVNSTLYSRISALTYWLVQLPIKPIIKKWATFVLVNNEEERKQFMEMDKQKRVIVCLGAVDTGGIGKWRVQNGKLPKRYDAVFQGRFHPQKGVLELIDIWKLVAAKKPDAKLVMIGDGPLMESVKCKVKSEKLGDNIKLAGYMFDGEEKYKIFSESRVVVHPAIFDSGGMASAEAMAFGLPCVGFNLRSYDSYYPKGMVKVPVGDFNQFALEILNLLSNKKKYTKTANDALDMINSYWSWEKRAADTLDLMVK